MSWPVYFDHRLQKILSETTDQKYHSVVAAVQDGEKWLLGLSKHDEDDRLNKWIMPGGGINSKESLEACAVREAREETGAKCKAASGPYDILGKPQIAVIHCRSTKPNQKLEPNHEFEAVDFFTISEMATLDLYNNVLDLIKKIKQ